VQRKQTTGALISELGVRTVLAMNLVVENHVSGEEREVHGERIAAIIDGTAGVGHSKVMQRSIERCAAGRWN